jgi:tetratricopeptide (TPR) repeat protein
MHLADLIEWRSGIGRSWVRTRDVAAADTQRIREALEALEKAAGEQREAEAIARNAELGKLALLPPDRWRIARGLMRFDSQIDSAVDHLRHAVEEAPDYAVAWKDLGVALHKAKRLEEAELAFEKAIEHNPNDFDAWSARGGAHKKMHERDRAYPATSAALQRAIDFYERAQSIAFDPYPFLNLVILRAARAKKLELSRGDEDHVRSALRLREKQIGQIREEPWASFDASTAHFLLGNEPRGLEALERGLGDAPKGSWMRATHKNTLEYLKGIEGILWLGRALELFERD